jgi:purine nucleoside phosphorylase
MLVELNFQAIEISVNETVTNAAGGLNQQYEIEDVVLLYNVGKIT